MNSGFGREIARRKIHDVHIGQKGCVGRCHLEPTVVVFQVGRPPFKYENVDAKLAKKIIWDHLVKNKSLKHPNGDYHPVSEDCLTDKSRFIFGDIDYFTKQKRIVLRNCGVIDPEYFSRASFILSSSLAVFASDRKHTGAWQIQSQSPTAYETYGRGKSRCCRQSCQKV